MKTFNLLDVKVSVTDLGQAASEISQWIHDKTKTYVCVAPVATIVDAYKDPAYLKVINEAGMVTPDGVPLVWAGRLKGEKNIKRTCGPDLMRLVCGEGVDRGYKHFLYGADDSTRQKLIDNLKMLCPGINITGSFSPGYLKVGEKESAAVIDQINAAGADILWIGLGSPKQDFWMANHRGDINVPVMVGVGAAFDFLAGVKKRAPVWMRQAGLEWFFRLCSEPKRLWKRYLYGNTLFVWLFFKEMIRSHEKKN
ncbi:MAG: WecB/TagA/CpsF family glycosyltransferase [Candidatus Omnitrophica bacterium]|nr:WecB/TagA/CpsF family glycosyltransferase [Candidatus Omnitrophota bacterium]